MKEPLREICFRHEEKVWHFFIDAENQLCCRSSPKEEKQWSETTVLQPNYGGRFVAALSNEGQIHLASTDRENRIWYHHLFQETWDSCTAAEILPSEEINDLSLTVDSRGRVHLLCCLRSHSNNWQWKIIHHYFDQKKWTDFLDSGTGPADTKTSASVDSRDDLHVVYSAPQPDGTPLIHKIFNISREEWKETQQIPLLHQENRQPCAVFDREDNLHLVWICSDGRNFRTVYNRHKNRPWPEGGWGIPQYLSGAGVNAYSPYILLAPKNAVVLWQQLDNVLYRISEDMGKSWGNITKQTAVRNLEDYTLNYFSPRNDDFEPLTAFSSSAPQVTLTTAASLWKSFNIDEDPIRSQLIPVKEEKTVIDTGDKLSPTIKKFLLRYGDTCVTNKLMNQTIDSLQKKLKFLNREKETLGEKIKKQISELNSFKSLSEMYRKEAESLKISHYQLEKNIAELEGTIEILLKKNEVLETALKQVREEKEK